MFFPAGTLTTHEDAAGSGIGTLGPGVVIVIVPTTTGPGRDLPFPGAT